MQRAEIDERMFISHVCENVDMVFNESLDDSAMTMLRRGNLDSSWAVDADLLLRMSTQRCMEKVQVINGVFILKSLGNGIKKQKC